MPIIADVTASSGPTLDELVTEITSAARGFSIAPDKWITLAGDMAEGALTFTVIGEASAGVKEIGDELVLVTAVDQESGTCTVHPRGRGWEGSVATAHLEGDVVLEGPALPRSRCAKMVNDAIAHLHPVLFGVGSVTEVTTGYRVELPAEAEHVLEVRELHDGEWHRARHYEAEMSSEHGTTGRAVRLPSTCIGTEVKVVYAARPEPFATVDQQWSDTGLSVGAKDVVVLDVLARFAQVLDIGRLTDRFVSPKGDPQQPQLGAGFGMARQLRADYETALAREALALRTLYPARSHFVR